MFPMILKEVANNHRIAPFLPLFDETASGFLPALDVYESAERYELRLDVPGVAKENLNIHLENDTLTIRGTRQSATEGRARSERWSGTFERTLSLPDGVDATRIDASVKDGVLTVFLPKGEKAKPRQITIT